MKKLVCALSLLVGCFIANAHAHCFNVALEQKGQISIGFALHSLSMAPKELKVLEEFVRPGMQYSRSMNNKIGGCMLRIQKLANNDGSNVHYAIAGYAIDKVDDQWIWHEHLSNSVRYDSVQGVYTAFVSGLGNVYFSI